jgi:hypothetical protein
VRQFRQIVFCDRLPSPSKLFSGGTSHLKVTIELGDPCIQEVLPFLNETKTMTKI